MENFIHDVQNLLATGEKCHLAIEAGLVQGWVKTTRLLAVVEYQNEYGLFLYSVTRTQAPNKVELHFDGVLPINGDFRCELETGGSENLLASDVFVKLTSQKRKFLFEMPFGSKTNQFVSEISKATEVHSRQTSSATFTWIKKYENNLNENPFAKDVFDPFTSGLVENSNNVEFEDDFSKVQLRNHSNANFKYDEFTKKVSNLESPDAFKHLPRESIAVGATPIAARDSVIRLQMTMREEEYTNLTSFRVFVGTWNVNGQMAAESLLDWLAADPEPPDVYAVGFQELDLSKEAFLFNDSPREEEWNHAVTIALHPGAQYVRIRLIRLVGMMLIVFIQEKHVPFVKSVAAETVGTGIMGKMGNKGGVAVRLELHNTSICFVNSHLAAHTEEFERRNQDYNDICARLSFSQFIPPKAIKDHDQVFWLGDLNYRISGLEPEIVKMLIDKQEFALLLESDQLKQQHKSKRVFVNYTEGLITFKPTYKYDAKTDNWDTSDKCRTPAWTDRILWKGSNIDQLAYRSHGSLKISDHKPVSAIFDSKIKVVDNTKHRQIFEEVMKKLDKLENEFLPQVAVDNTEVHFGNVRFIEPRIQYLTIANTGQVPVQFEFIKKLNDTSYCKEWLKITPYTSLIRPGEKCDIELEVFVDKHSVHKLNCGEDGIDDILVLHLENGKDIFITVSGSFEPTSFGMSLDSLVLMHAPVRDVPVAQLIDLELSTTKETHSPEAFDIPKEIWFLVDHLFRNSLEEAHIFEQPGLHSELIAIREFLDTGMPNKIPGSVHSAAEALLLFLESLPVPVIPNEFYNQCLESANNYTMCRQLLAKIPLVHRNVFKYLTSFLKEVLLHSDKNRLDIKTLSTLFGRVMIRAASSLEKTDNSILRRSSAQAVDRKKATFIYHFLVNDYDG